MAQMKNSKSFEGTGKVFRFTVKQFFKSRANVISFVILLLLALASVPMISLFSSRGGDPMTSLSDLETVYVKNGTGYDELSPTSLSQITKQYSDVEFFGADDDFDETELGKKDLLVSVEYNEENNVFKIDVLSSKDSSAGIIAKEQLATIVRDQLNAARFAGSGYGELLNVPEVSVNSGKVEDYGKEGKDFGVSFGVQYGYSIIMMMFCMLSASYIIRSVIEEKSSKLVDLMLVSVKPDSLMAGKILGVMTCVFTMIISFIAAIFLSYFVSGLFMDVTPVKEIITSPSFSKLLGGFGFRTVLIVLVSALLGYLTFSAISGIFGATSSSLEEVEPTNTAVVFLILFVYFIALFCGMTGGRVMGTVISLVPLVSVFSAPAQFVLGNIGLPVLILSWVIQAAVALGLLKLCSKVYSGLVLYKGTRLKLRQVFSVLRGKSVS